MSDNDVDADVIAPSRYSVLHQFQTVSPVSGVAVVYRRNIQVSKVRLQFVARSFDSLVVKIETQFGPLNIAAVYRPPSTSPHGVSVRQFRKDLATYIDELLELDGELLLCGDINCPDKNTTRTANPRIHESVDALLSSRQLVQRVVGSTHQDGNILDVLITEKDSTLSTKPRLLDVVFSDHKLVLSKLTLELEAASCLFGQLCLFFGKLRYD